MIGTTATKIIIMEIYDQILSKLRYGSIGCEKYYRLPSTVDALSAEEFEYELSNSLCNLIKFTDPTVLQPKHLYVTEVYTPFTFSADNHLYSLNYNVTHTASESGLTQTCFGISATITNTEKRIVKQYFDYQEENECTGYLTIATIPCYIYRTKTGKFKTGGYVAYVYNYDKKQYDILFTHIDKDFVKENN